MKVAPTKKQIGDFFVSFGLLPLVFLVGSYLAFFYGVNNANVTKAYERVNFFVETYGVKDPTFRDSLLSSLSDKGCREVNLYAYSIDDDSLTNYYDRYGSESDFLIFSKDDLDDLFQEGTADSVYDSFIPFADEVKGVLGIEGSQFYEANGQDFAYLIHSSSSSGNDSSPWDKLFAFAKDGEAERSYYLLLNSSTPNFKSLQGAGTTDLGTEAFKWIMAR